MAQAQAQAATSVADLAVECIRLMIMDAVSSIASVSKENWSNAIIAFTLLFLAAKIWDLTKSIRELEATMTEIKDETCTDEDATNEDDVIETEQDAGLEIINNPFISDDITMQRRLSSLNREVAMRAAMDLRKRTAMDKAVRILKEAGREGDRDAGGRLGMRGR